jgi:hypothetical protein
MMIWVNAFQFITAFGYLSQTMFCVTLPITITYKSVTGRINHTDQVITIIKAHRNQWRNMTECNSTGLNWQDLILLS